jgi:hypothetical protein
MNLFLEEKVTTNLAYLKELYLNGNQFTVEVFKKIGYTLGMDMFDSLTRIFLQNT